VTVFVLLAMHTSKTVHERLFRRLAESPMSYFDTTPSGTILNHFSKDLDAMDTLLPQYAIDFGQDIALLAGIVCVVVWSTPPALIAVIPVLLSFGAVRAFYSRTARQTKRMDSNARGPVYTMISDVADGLVTVRAHAQMQGVTKAFTSLVDSCGKSFFQTFILQPWCILTLDSLGATIVCITAISCVSLRGTLPMEIATLAISYALLTRGKMQFCVRLSVEAENHLIAVERLHRFEAELVSEEEIISGTSSTALAVGSEWPVHGALSFMAVQLRYRPGLPLALRHVDLEVQAGAKVGIVGRTGSGKSSLLAAVLRLTELEEGTICIDGVNVRNVSLQTLRSVVTAVPQDPLLWDGTVAQNLDPTNTVEEQYLSDALERVGLNQGPASVGGLGAAVETHGGNLSLGQRQLLCIARCILRRSCVVLVDEATANIDAHTDTMLQEAFKLQFSSCTLLVVAHRIKTVLDADQVVVLEDGAVVEKGSPGALLSDGASHFAGLARGGITAKASVSQRACSISL